MGKRFSLGGHDFATLVSETGRSARIDNPADTARGPLAVPVREAGIRSAVGVPVIVEGRLWGVVTANSSLEQPLPPDTEARLASFTELVATAIANADGRAELMASRAPIVAAADETRRRIERDLHDHVEVAASYAVSEALANAAKHARASVVHVELDTPDATLRLAIRDEGVGGADPARGSGLTGLRDRVEAVGGTFDVTSPAGGGTTLLIAIPV